MIVTNKKRGGTYLDIGCYVPKEGNNTWLLDVEFRWEGISIDRQEFQFANEPRRGTFFVCDATVPYPSGVIKARDNIAPEGIIDYLSMDVDEDTNKALVIAMDFAKYSVVTLEHDVYARGVDQQQWQRELMNDHGYVLQVCDVHIPGKPELVFEDWYCAPSLAFCVMDSSPNDAKQAVQTLWRNQFSEEAPI